MDTAQTQALEHRMNVLQQSIPFGDRCPKCQGKGWIQIGCALSHNIYDHCLVCHGTGRAKAYSFGEIFNSKEMIKRIEICPTCNQWALEMTRTDHYSCENGHYWRLNRHNQTIEKIDT